MLLLLSTSWLMPEKDQFWLHGDVFSVLQTQVMLRLMVHAGSCRYRGGCQYPNCRKLKSLFHHGKKCKTRTSGGCRLCKQIWSLIHLHARGCKESQCNLPRCRYVPIPMLYLGLKHYCNAPTHVSDQTELWLGTGIWMSMWGSCNWCNGSLSPGGVLPSIKWWCNGSLSPVAELQEMVNE